MQLTSRVLTILSVLATLTGFTLYAFAASPTGCLPNNGAISGWKVFSETRSGAMGEKASYDTYDGPVDVMKQEGIRYFAQRMFRSTTGKRYVTVDAFQLRNAGLAKALYAKKRASYKTAKPLTDQPSIRDRAFIGTVGKTTVGVVQRGIFVAEVTMSNATTDADRAKVKAFLTYISRKLGE